MTRVPLARRMPAFAMRCYSWFAGFLRSNHLLFRLLFGFEPPVEASGLLWDWTTLLLKRVLSRCIGHGASVLDMGTGPVAVLAVYASGTPGCGSVCAVDHLTEVVHMARRSVLMANVPVDVRQGCLFEPVEGLFDVIAFNAPYIDTVSGSRLHLLQSEEARQRWCGGVDGLDTVRRFLSGAHDHLSPGGCVLLGVNRFYVPPAEVEALIERYGWSAARVKHSRWTRAAVYSLKARAAAN